MPDIPRFFLPGAAVAAALTVFSAPALGAGISEAFDVTSGGSLVLEADGSTIDVQGRGDDEMTIRITRGDDDADAIEEDYDIEFSMDGNSVTGTVKRKSRFGNWIRRGLQIDIELPESFDVNLKTSGGRIDIESLSGVIEARTSGGSLSFEDVDGPITGRTSGGSIHLDGTSGDADLQTSGGKITIGTVAGAITARTSGGSISIDGAGSGVEAHTSGGGVSATFRHQPEADSTLSTSGGSVEVRLHPDIAVSLDAKTSGGSVRTELPVTVVGEVKRTRLTGDLNGGGPLLHLRTSGGSIRITSL
jgi:DUF4097 and DUF4098 domain-containing protein YvlB